jgi:hypothetical protein
MRQMISIQVATYNSNTARQAKSNESLINKHVLTSDDAPIEVQNLRNTYICINRILERLEFNIHVNILVLSAYYIILAWILHKLYCIYFSIKKT